MLQYKMSADLLAYFICDDYKIIPFYGENSV